MSVREKQLADILNHLESDMGICLDVLKRETATEVMLNAYPREDGSFEGHLWYEESGVGMKRMIEEQRIKIDSYILPQIGDTVVIRDFNNEIFNWHVLTSDTVKNNSIISMVLKYVIRKDGSDNYYLDQDEHYKLNQLADNIKISKYHYKTVIPEEHLQDLNLLIDEINKQLPSKNIFFKLKLLKITNNEEIKLFSKLPSYMIHKEFLKMSHTKAEQIMGILASANSKHIHEDEPTLECAIPFYNHRFTGQLEPVVKFPTFTIRKHSSRIITQDEYVATGVQPEVVKETVESWVKKKYNILVCGGTGSGKTTYCNSIIDTISKLTPWDRIGILEDTPELQCGVDNYFSFTTSRTRDMDALLRTMLRMRPDRIILGELRGREAYTLLKAWMTGHPGGLSTIHANGAREAVFRFEQCMKESKEVGNIPRDQIGFAINGVISIQKVNERFEKDGHMEFRTVRKVTAVREITGYDSTHDRYADIYLHKDDNPFVLGEESEEKKFYLD